MNRIVALICYNLGMWGVLGFFLTLVLGFLTCCANLSPKIFYSGLIVFALLGICTTVFCIARVCKKTL